MIILGDIEPVETNSAFMSESTKSNAVILTLTIIQGRWPAFFLQVTMGYGMIFWCFWKCETLCEITILLAMPNVGLCLF